MRKPLVAGNWKMHGSLDQLQELLGRVIAETDGSAPAEVLVCPAYVFLDRAAQMLADSPVRLGGQNLCEHGEGAYTGEVSGAMLRDVGCDAVIVGHSERRSLYGESDALVAAKFVAAQGAGLVPILCVGETLEERDAGTTESVVARQLEAVTDQAGVEALADAVLAYEPVWAIGTGKTATPDMAQEVHAFIRELVAQKNAKIAGSLRILYGGSVKPGNAANLFSMADVDGGLIGGASLKAMDFLAIVAAAGT